MNDIDELFDNALPLRTLIFDIETAPLMAYTWGVWQQNVQPNQLARNTYMICWAAKWEGQKTVHSDVLTGAEAVAEDDSRVVQSLADLIRKADLVVAHNGDRFDIPVLNTRLLDMRLEPLPPVRSVDTLKVAKRAFRITYNRLNFLAEFLGHDLKYEMSMADWIQATKGVTSALRKMNHYCRQDVGVLERVWFELKPYAKGLPRMVDARREMQRACPSCGSGSLVPAGWHRTNASNFARYRCEGCGRYARSRSSARGTKLELHPL